MDGREAMAFPGSHTQYYLQRGAFPNLTPSQVASGLHAPPPPPPPGFRPMSNPNIHHPQAGPPFSMAEQQHRHSDFGHSIHMGMGSSASAAELQPPPPPPPAGTPTARKKRGRPRKYAPDGQVSLGLSPMPCVSNNKSKDSSPMSDDPNAPRRARGRPPGTGRKQRLATHGEWMNASAGSAFAPHVISVEAGEDIVAKIVSFSQQRPRTLCIMSGTGTVSSVTLRQPALTTPHLTFKGRFDILSLGGSYLVNDEGGSKSRTGGLSVSLSDGDGEGRVIGGGISMLIAASLVQVVACSFVYGASAKFYNTNYNKTIRQEKEPKEEHNNSDLESTPCSAPEAAASAGQQTPPNFSAAQGMSEWPGSGSGSGRSLESSRNLLTDIDLTRG
ncbi:PREDICTED: AT-hook motif nuclear-localized protein 5-like isoform X3 [Camelina sativa]|uniref:AT-hook motif nuclear-localized protein n=2 Tax=Camelina sativa TaxID=90675 RepID=A0ABM0WNB4_CAMSA|nr:PREDICTED: AT-hook motif nuclear-localized protein 5-like isoform X1 [Camelina sativa]XP_010473586.1 PREDICTED: AT-hook motif nuclear-localized protein 5-like isoform X1 [Camelina sativa]XP_010473592.1 PREDICTED: AT-hook motif nuclear-localized protein 5-like isoform X3 [Camelina sativa]